MAREVVVGASGAAGGSVIGPTIYNACSEPSSRSSTAIKAAPHRSRDEARRGRRTRQQHLGGLQGDDAQRSQGWHAQRMIQTGLRKDRDLQRVPLFLDLVKGDPAREPVAKFMSQAVAIARPVAAPPGVPPDRVEVLRRAFDATMKDPVFLAEAAKLNAEIDPLTGEGSDIVTAVLVTPKP